MLAAAAFQYFRPLPVTAATSIVPTVEHVGTAPALPWPDRPPASAGGRVRVPVTDGDRGDGPLAFLLDPIALQRLEGGMLLVLSLLLFWKYSAAWLLYVAPTLGEGSQ